MNQKVKEILDGFKNLAYEEKKQVVKEIFPGFLWTILNLQRKSCPIA